MMFSLRRSVSLVGLAVVWLLATPAVSVAQGCWECNLLVTGCWECRFLPTSYGATSCEADCTGCYLGTECDPTLAAQDAAWSPAGTLISGIQSREAESWLSPLLVSHQRNCAGWLVRRAYGSVEAQAIRQRTRILLL